MPSYPIALIATLLTVTACTKKTEPAPEPAPPQAEENQPEDSTHLKAAAERKKALEEKLIEQPSIVDQIEPGKAGEMFLKAKKSPITIMKLQAIANKEKTL